MAIGSSCGSRRWTLPVRTGGYSPSNSPVLMPRTNVDHASVANASVGPVVSLESRTNTVDASSGVAISTQSPALPDLVDLRHFTGSLLDEPYRFGGRPCQRTQLCPRRLKPPH